ncbi:MAG: DUF2946 family protein [Rhodoferax sp.]|nr:DUF2946 family protein [Rhodoferax sp.]
MTFLHTLRNTPWLARLALLWFALTLGVAVASPLVNPQTEVQICSASAGMVNIVLNADGSTGSSTLSLDCPLCAVGLMAPPVAISVADPVPPLGPVTQRVSVVIITARTAAPPSSRGPPEQL